MWEEVQIFSSSLGMFNQLSRVEEHFSLFFVAKDEFDLTLVLSDKLFRQTLQTDGGKCREWKSRPVQMSLWFIHANREETWTKARNNYNVIDQYVFLSEAPPPFTRRMSNINSVTSRNQNFKTQHASSTFNRKQRQ